MTKIRRNKVKIKNMIIGMATLCCMTTQIAYSQQQQENRFVLYPVQPTDSMIEIVPGQSFSREIQLTQPTHPVRRMLRVVGGVKMPGKFSPRGEEFFRQAEYLIDDNLDSVCRKKEKYSLYFKGYNEAFERYAYYRVINNLLPKGKVTLEIAAKRNNLKISPNGEFGVLLELFYKKEGRHADEIYDRPDSTLFMPITAGSGAFTTFKQTFHLPQQVVCAVVRLGGTYFSGECWLESPRLTCAGKNGWKAPFVKHENRPDNYNYWVGVNLSTRSWPKWTLSFGEKILFDGNIFDRASDVADFYIDLPADCVGNGTLSLTLQKEPNRAAFPYQLRSVQLIEESARDFEIISLPHYMAVGKQGGMLIEINRPNTSFTIQSDDAVSFEQKQYTFAETGLHVIPFHSLRCASQVKVSLSSGSDLRTAFIGQIIWRDFDDVYLSSGDEIHIDKEYAPYNYFFKWYVRERIGNWYQFRPSYQWSGVRIVDNKLIAHYTGLLNALQMPYAWQVEGRTLAASRINASLEALNTPMFRGKQAHENDGGYYYWRHFKYIGLFSDFAARTRPYGGIFAKHRPLYTDHGVFIHYDPQGIKDMAQGAEMFVKNLAYSRGESIRHTGPSTMFRYLYQAGYEWLGAEQMYGPEETIMSSLRGASRAYGKKLFGSLHAMQWGSFPFTDPKHAQRLYLSLAVAYMHGSSHINTEEALWTDEYANDRYTEAGKRHAYAQRQVLDYIETHSRKGELMSHIAVLQGRNDAWKSFGRSPIWSQEGADWAFGKAQESFDLLNVFYPGNILDSSAPEGWFTRTPYGTVDILPIEASDEVLSQYKSLIFLGWNSFDANDFSALARYVHQGGKLLLSAAHINSELHPTKPVRFPEDDTVLKKMLGENYRTYRDKQVIAYGKGTIVYYPQPCYPADENIYAQYKQSIEELAQNSVQGENVRGWITNSPHIGFTVWDTPQQRTLYALNIDWQSDATSRKALLHLGTHQFVFDVANYQLLTITCADSLAVAPQANTSAVLSIREQGNNRLVEVQTCGADNIYVCNAITGKKIVYSVQSAGKHILTVPMPK